MGRPSPSSNCVEDLNSISILHLHFSPGASRHDVTVMGYRYPPAPVARAIRQQILKRCALAHLSAASVDGHVHRNTCRTAIVRSKRRGEKPSTTLGGVLPLASAATAAAVIGVSRIPLR
jgi:hypothetical protein